MRTPTVLLFDIDGTLVSTGGAGRRAMRGAFTKLHGAPDAFEGFSFAGMTDRAIVRHGLRAAASPECGWDEPRMSAEIDRLLDAYLDLLAAELEQSEGYRVLPGVLPLLESLRDLAAVAIGLGTGNVRRGAYAKLARGAIHDAFAFGGFGCDAEDRVELLRAGARRGAEALRVSLGECRVVIIGDTPKDVHAARALGATCVGVSTGGYAAPELLSCGAHRAFGTLEDEGVFDALFA